MHVYENRVHPDWIARLEMFRQFTSRSPEPQDIESTLETPPPVAAATRWPLPKVAYRHRSTFSPRPR